jgi:hypothetical protein
MHPPLATSDQKRCWYSGSVIMSSVLLALFIVVVVGRCAQSSEAGSSFEFSAYCQKLCLWGRGGNLCRCNAVHFVGKRRRDGVAAAALGGGTPDSTATAAAAEGPFALDVSVPSGGGRGRNDRDDDEEEDVGSADDAANDATVPDDVDSKQNGRRRHDGPPASSIVDLLEIVVGDSQAAASGNGNRVVAAVNTSAGSGAADRRVVAKRPPESSQQNVYRPGRSNDQLPRLLASSGVGQLSDLLRWDLPERSGKEEENVVPEGGRLAESVGVTKKKNWQRQQQQLNWNRRHGNVDMRPKIISRGLNVLTRKPQFFIISSSDSDTAAPLNTKSPQSQVRKW